MYVAPLNLDRFFKKVFFDLEIAKAFLQDVLDVTIQHIEMLPLKNRVSDGSVPVEFDFRCMIDGKPVVIEMQKTYDADVIRRFYMYHAINTALQMERLPKKPHPFVKGENKKQIDYKKVEPVITLVWLSIGTLKTKGDFLNFTVLPEELANWLKDDAAWQNSDLAALVLQRRKMLALLKNNTKSLGFLSKNRLIFALQKNIVKNKKHSKYFKWFDFAEKSGNLDNREEDFLEYKKDETMSEVMDRLYQYELTEEDFQFLTMEELKKLATKIGEAKGERKGIKIGEQKARAEEQKKRHLEKLEFAKFLLKEGFPIEKIMGATKLSRQEIEKLQSPERLA